MVTKLKDNISYIKYIREKVEENFPEWNEYGGAVYKNQINNNFQVDYIGSIIGYTDSVYKVSFIKDRGLLELKLYYQNNPVFLGYLISNGIIENISDQDKKWSLSICVELIDYYIEFLKFFFIKQIIL